MGNVHIETDNGKFYVYDQLESGGSICVGVYDTDTEAQKRVQELIAIENKRAA